MAPVKGEVKELLKHKFLDVDLPYELRVTEAALTEFIRCAFPDMQTTTGPPDIQPGTQRIRGLEESALQLFPVPATLERQECPYGRAAAQHAQVDARGNIAIYARQDRAAVCRGLLAAAKHQRQSVDLALRERANRRRQPD